MGATPEQLAELEAQEAADEPEEPQHYEVWPANWPAVQVFNDCSGQWRLSPAGVPCAIDRAALAAAIELGGVELTERRDCFARIRVMENIAANEFKRRAKK